MPYNHHPIVPASAFSKHQQPKKAWPIIEERIIGRSEHKLSRRDISPNTLKVLYRLNKSGYRACLVGGAVRDILIGREPKDFDVATDATPEQVSGLFRNCRLIGRRFRLAHVFFGREIIEVATFRGHHDDGSGDRQLDEGRLIFDNVYGTMEEDAIRRDFTANSLYYDIKDYSIRDFTGGFDDVEQRLLRLIGVPRDRYVEDPVRLLRAVRFSASLDFEIEPETKSCLAEMGDLLDGIPPARLFEEMLKLFFSGSGEKVLDVLHQHDLLRHLFPDAFIDADGNTVAPNEFLRAAIKNTDERVRSGKSVTPAFLSAAILWQPFRERAAKLTEEGASEYEALMDAADWVFSRQVRRLAIPRRFSSMTKDIWLMQPRFKNRARKRVLRLLNHKRFRAAYDFLILRQLEQPDLAESGAWWTKLQTLHGDEQAAFLVPPGQKRRPRRRRSHSNS